MVRKDLDTLHWCEDSVRGHALAMAGSQAKWREIVSGCLAELLREQAGSACPVVDYEVRTVAATMPDDTLVWFICRNHAEKAQFAATERARTISVFKKKLLAAGFPESAVASLEIAVTSRHEVDQAGGGLFFSSARGRR